MAKLFNEGMTIKEISKEMGHHEATISRYLTLMGYSTKLRSEVPRTYTAEEKIAKQYLESKNFKIINCRFLCKINLRNKITYPKGILEFCAACPIKKVPLYPGFLFDFLVVGENGSYIVVEVKSCRRRHQKNPFDTPLGFAFSQCVNIGKLVRAGVPVKVLQYNGEEKLIDEIDL